MSSDLNGRIRDQRWCPNVTQSVGSMHPALTPAGGRDSLPDGMVMPMTVVQINAGGIDVQQAAPLYAGGPERAPIPATGPGRWQQLYAAGRP